MMTPEIQQKWESAAWALTEVVEKLPIPFHVLAGEALDVTRFCQRNWEPAQDRTGQVIRPGLKSAGPKRHVQREHRHRALGAA
jgi:hypothetical protein